MKNRVKEFRAALGLTQQQLAGLAHVTAWTIISIDKGQYSPSLLLAYRIALALGTPMETLYCLEENKQQEDQQYEDL